MTQQVSGAWGDYFQGRSLTARRTLAEALKAPDAQAPVIRLAVLEALLDICIQSHAEACVRDNAQAYVDTAETLAGADAERRREYALRAAYYFDRGRLALHEPEVTAKIQDWPPWTADAAGFPRLELQRQVLAARIRLELDDPAGARREIDKLLAMAAALDNPREDRLTFAWAVTEAIWALTALGESDRAYGLYRAASPAILRILPPRSPDAATFRLVEANLLQEQGILKGAVQALDEAIAILDGTEFDPDVRRWLLSQALTAKAAACVLQAGQTCARDALARHPLRRLYDKPGRKPADYDEVAYLAARALAESFAGGQDPVAAEALKGPLGFKPAGSLAAEVEVYRALGAALGQPPGEKRAPGLFEAGRKLVAMSSGAPRAGFGVWRRPNAIERIMIRLALTQADSRRAGADDTMFALFQMAARDGSTFDADAQTALAQADSEAERQAVHDALRIKARRDQLERRELRAAADRMINPAAGADLTYTARLRDLLQAASDHIAATDRGLAGSRAASAGANLVALKRLQAALGPDEAALSLTMIPSGFAYACVRRDLVQRRVLGQDLNQYILDLRIVQAALTAGHAPSEAMDTQFPVSAAVRLHQALIQPFDGCLRPGDRILWISGISSTAIPLSVFLERAPPKLADGGYDLAAADWLMRRHVVSYPGSAGFIVAARSTPRPATALDFLGVGDPVLKPVAGGPDLSALAALPETKDELKASAKGFSKVKLMLGEAATEAAVRREPLSEYRFLSFATHGLMRGELEGLEEPALALTPVSATRGNDGLLTASEIADLTLAARFVALSACNTANFDLGLVSGELSALSSAFAMAGAPSVLGTMWPVDSETGERVVAATFQALAAAPDTDPAEALARAQRAFLAAPPSRAYAHPRFWAPFVVLGDGGGSQTALR